MSPVSWPVVVVTLLLGAPAIWAAAVDRTLSTDVAAMRVGLCLLAAWAALSMAASLSDGAMSRRALAAAATEPADDSAPEVQQQGEQH